VVDTTIMGCSAEAIVSGLQGSIKHLTAANEEKHVALEDANAEIKELKEFMESVSINNVCKPEIL